MKNKQRLKHCTTRHRQLIFNYLIFADLSKIVDNSALEDSAEQNVLKTNRIEFEK